MTQRIRIGIIGAGSNTKARHIPGLKTIGGVEIVAVCNRSLESSRRVCDQFGIPRACATHGEILNDPDIDAIVIGTWPYMHKELTVAALAAGKHVLCEARMAMNAAEGEAMLAASRLRPQLVAQIVPSPFTLGIDEALRRLVATRLGQVHSVRLEMIAPMPAQRPLPRTWRRNRALSGNNIMAVGIWYEALARWVGPAAWVHAMLRTCVGDGVDPDTGQSVVIDVPDHVEAIGELARGGALSLSATAASDRPAGNHIYIQGDGGLIDVSGSSATFTARGGRPEPIHPDPAAGWRVEAEFIGAIRGLERIRCTDLETALADMRFTDALHESHRLGQAVRVA